MSAVHALAPPAARPPRGAARRLVSGRDAMAAPRPRSVRADVGFSTDSMNERDLAAGLAQANPEVTAFSAAALAGQDDLVGELVAFSQSTGLDVFFHALDLDPCGSDKPDPGLLRTLAEYARALGSPWITTDLAMWVRNGEQLLGQYVAMPLVDAAVPYVADRVAYLQDVMQTFVVLENSAYETIVGERDILQLMGRIAERADCGLCLDVGHLHILRAQRGQPIRQPGDDLLPWNRFVEAHLSGIAPRPCRGGDLIADWHAWPVSPALWSSFDYFAPRLTHAAVVVAESEGMTPEDLAEKMDGLASHLAVQRSLAGGRA